MILEVCFWTVPGHCGVLCLVPYAPFWVYLGNLFWHSWPFATSEHFHHRYRTDMFTSHCQVDAAGGGRDLRHTIYSVISDQAQGYAKEMPRMCKLPCLTLLTIADLYFEQVRRESLLQHFVDQVADLNCLPVHILSDIDMTVWVGTFGAGPGESWLPQNVQGHANHRKTTHICVLHPPLLPPACPLLLSLLLTSHYIPQVIIAKPLAG